eukprot:6612047-Pyramimonas_sp.AAC.1
MFLLFRICTGEDWNSIMNEYLAKDYYWSAPFFIIFLLLVYFVMLNLFVSIILENFNEASRLEDNKGINDGPPVLGYPQGFPTETRTRFCILHNSSDVETLMGVVDRAHYPPQLAFQAVNAAPTLPFATLPSGVLDLVFRSLGPIRWVENKTREL